MIAFKNISYTPILHLRRGERKRTSRWPAAVERREASVPRRADTVKANLRGDARTYVTGPLLRVPMHPTSVGAPLPSLL